MNFRSSVFHLGIFFGLLTMTFAAFAGNKLEIITSVAPITNIVKNIAGDRANVEGIVPEGVNSHTFEPAPSDARRLRRADLIIMNGLHLELPTIKLAESVKKAKTKIVHLGDLTLSPGEWKFDFSFPKDKGHPNPHLWPNIMLAKKYAELSRDALIEVDPSSAEIYRKNTDSYVKKLMVLDEAIFACVKAIPKNQRKLVTYHDSYAYFAPRYGMTVVGAIQPADFSEPTPREVIRIIKQLRKEKVPAVFGSEVFESKVLEQIAKEAGAKFIDQLADDDLPGKASDSNHSFIGMMVNNMQIMSEALGGNPRCVDGVDASNNYE